MRLPRYAGHGRGADGAEQARFEGELASGRSPPKVGAPDPRFAAAGPCPAGAATHPSGATDRRPLPRLVEASAPLPRPVHAAPSFRADGSPASLEPKAKLFQSVDPAGGRLTGRALERRVVLAMKLYDRTADTVTVDEIERIVI